MTFRAKPVVRRSGRSGWDGGDRKTALINIAFVVAIIAAVVILIAYGGYSWWDDHNGTAASVNGTVITKDQLRTRYKIEKFRIDYTEQRIRTLNQAGRISDSAASQQISFLEQRRTSLPAIALERLIDNALQEQLAKTEGVTVTDADVDGQLTDEATTDAERHVWMIEVAPENDPLTGRPGDAEKAAAKKKADDALTQITSGGKKWEDVATAVSTDASSTAGGDIGWLPEKSGYDADFMKAVFGVEKDKPTAVVEGADGAYRIGRWTESVDATVDATFKSQVESAGIAYADYRTASRGDVFRNKLEDKVVADLSKPDVQRHVLEIYLKEETPGAPDAVKVRHILFSPKDDPAGAKDLPATDPAWAAAEAEAKAAYDTLVKDPSQFDQMARTKSDEASAKSTGGKLPWYDATSQIDLAFKNAILDPKRTEGEIVPPFKSSFGWHVVQIIRKVGSGDAAYAKTLKDKAVAGADFAQLAKDQSEAADAGSGGDMGWIAHWQLGDAQDAAIWKVSVGGVTDPVTVSGDGIYIYKVLAEETRPPTKEQIAAFKDSGYINWYSRKKTEAKIERSPDAAKVIPQ